MADENSRYLVTITLDIRDMKNGEPTEFSKTIQQYSDVPYEMMWQLQAVAVPALVEMLIGMGAPFAEELRSKRGQGQSKLDEMFAR